MAKPKAPGQPPPPYIEVDLWTLRCLYNKSDYAERISSGTFVVLRTEPGPFRDNGVRSMQVYYGVAGDGMYVKLQWFEDVSGAILRSGFKDPKQVYMPDEPGPADYHPHNGNSWLQKTRREPETILGKDNHGKTALSRAAIKAQRVYGRYRTWKCVSFGPVEARRQLARFLARQARDGVR
jgi:hypothetical protein